MSDKPHDFSKGIGTVGVEGHPAWQFACGECGWSHTIATAGAPAIQQCPWCGWEEIEPNKVGAFATFRCSVHGQVTCLISNPNIEVGDYQDLYCPHCRVIAGQNRS